MEVEEGGDEAYKTTSQAYPCFPVNARGLQQVTQHTFRDLIQVGTFKQKGVV